jgi:succinate dehydrogenase / fumarate reductase cytochrome b subunit
MAERIAPTVKSPRVFTNIHVTDIVHYRLPPSGWASILHRISGAVLFLLLPLTVWLFDTSVSSEVSYERFHSAFVAGVGPFAGWFVKLVTLGLIWGYLTHFFVGLRHLYMDMTHAVSKEQGKTTALAAIILSLVLTVLLGAKLFGLY